ncbi:aminotransferase class III-fold pyridoxal phosphate-dependent enzyme, partial [Xanthomonas citri pv. citri]|nr:aminotransferase class III-fold pyridoxal phosphate-dependent enzyme [Xanthomonas citri pv. citri]
MLAVTAANGVWLQLHDGEHRHEVIDAMASWWCQIHGYRNPVLDEALNRQSSQFSHV